MKSFGKVVNSIKKEFFEENIYRELMWYIIRRELKVEVGSDTSGWGEYCEIYYKGEKICIFTLNESGVKEALNALNAYFVADSVKDVKTLREFLKNQR